MEICRTIEVVDILNEEIVDLEVLASNAFITVVSLQ